MSSDGAKDSSASHSDMPNGSGAKVPRGVPAFSGTNSYLSIAKITRPKSSGIIPRERLFRTLDDCREQNVIWITAPAGSGKSTLVASYLEDRKLPAIWYRVDCGDEDIATFFYYMGLAAKQAAPRKRGGLPLFTPEYALGIHAFTLRYFENLFCRLKPPLVFVFDDYHQAPDSSSFHEVIEAGLAILPEGMQGIVISRSAPPPQFARLRVSRNLVLLETDCINFTLEETRELIRMDGRPDLSAQVVRCLHERTRGWVAGILLMKESIVGKGEGEPLLLDQTPQELFDYFASEILARTDPETIGFMLRTAFLPGMTEVIAARLAGDGAQPEILPRLYRNGFFIEKTIQQESVYRYHPLFREFLQKTARVQLSSAQVQEILRMAAELLTNSGRFEDAAEMLHSAGAWDRLAGLILFNARSLVDQGRSMTLETWIGRLPETIAGSIPWLDFWLGVCRMSRDLQASRVYFERAFRAFGACGEDMGELLSWSGAVESIIFAWDDLRLLDPFVEWLDNRMNRNPTFMSPMIGARVAACMAVALFWRFPFRTDLLAWLECATTLAIESQDANLELNLMSHAVCVRTWTGSRDSLERIDRHVKPDCLARECTTFTCLLWKTTEAMRKTVSPLHYREVLGDVAECLEAAERTGVHILDHTILIQGVVAAFCSQDLALAGRYLERLKPQIEGGPRQSQGQYYLFSAWRDFLLGNLAPALAAAEKALEVVEETGVVPPEIVVRQLRAQILFARGEREQALTELERARNLAFRLGEKGLPYFVCMLTEAHFQFELGYGDAALSLLRHALELGHRNDIMSMVFFWQPAVMTALCRRALQNDIEVEYVRRFISSYQLYPESPPLECEGWPWPLKIRTLGRFEILLNDESVTFTGKVQKKPLLLLKALIALGGSEVREERLTHLLWPDADSDKAHSAFSSALCRLRRLLGRDDAIFLHEQRVTLNRRLIWIDAWAFEEFGRRADALVAADETTHGKEGTPDRIHRERYDTALALYRGAFLAEEGNLPWLQSCRKRLRRRLAFLAVKYGSTLEDAGQWHEAATVYRDALERDEVNDEELYFRMMICCRKLGMRTAAVDAYRRCRMILATTLGIGPSPRMEELYRETLE